MPDRTLWLVAKIRDGSAHLLVNRYDLVSLLARVRVVRVIAQRQTKIAQREFVERGLTGVVEDVGALDVG